jgi:hypothetical protein
MTTRNIAIDPLTGGFVFVGGVLQLVADVPSIVQAARIRLQTVAGELLFDKSLGLPLFTQVLVKNPDPLVLAAVFRKVLLSVKGVSRVNSINFNFDRPTRTLTVAWQAVSDAGALVADQQALPA